jgi:23S rRNA (guanine745-N1)-methyltransferase
MILNTSNFICPVCGNKLFDLENSLRCFSGHSFDKSKDGYVNLLMKNSANKRHGDDKLMVLARKNFLDKGFYSNLRQSIAKILGSGNLVLDSGCGEGYYTSLFAENNTVLGIDISKDALKYASKRCKKATFAVASISDIPLADSSVDAVLNIFAPDSPKEFLRVLKKKGRLIEVLPLENHLFELKEKIYENPYKNPEPNFEKSGFKIKSVTEVKYKINIETNEDIVSLFKMTPYYYKTSRNDQQKIQNIEKLSVSLEFAIAEYEKFKTPQPLSATEESD